MTRKITLLFFIFTLTLLGRNSAFAQDETYDFESLSGVFSYGASYSAISGGHYWETIGDTPIYGRFASSTNANRGWFFNSGSLRCWGGRYNPELAICNLHEGDRIKITFTNSLKFVSGSAKIGSTAVTSGQNLITEQELTTTSDGDIIVKGDGENGSGRDPIPFTFIKKIEIYYYSNRTYNFSGVISDDVKPGGYETTLDGVTIYPLNFLEKFGGGSYSGNFNHPDNYRFAIKEQGWRVNNDGLYNNSNDSFYGFCILNLKEGDQITVYYANTDNVTYPFRVWTDNTNLARESSVASGGSFTMTSDGTVQIAIGKNVHLQSINIKSIAFRFSKWTDTYDLVNLNYTEPTLIGASGLSITYTGNNPKVAIPNSSTGDLMIVNTGDVTITASTTVGGTTYSASYMLTVMAAEAIWDVRNGNECFFPNTNPDNPSSNDNTGKLLMRRVTSVPHITMEFGDANNENLAMVTFRPDNNGVRAANLIDQSGWLHIWLEPEYPGSNTLKPYQGTFYKFQPTISGNLTITGVLHHNTTNSRIVLVDADATSGDRAQITRNNTPYYSYYIKQVLDVSGGPYVTAENIYLTAGHTYYLYANTPNTDSQSTDWQAFYLSGFKYETTFKFPYQNVVMGNSGVTASGYNHIAASTNYQQTINNAGQQNNITYSRICKGNISADINANTGELSNISGHGAIVVTATLTEGNTTNKTSYVLTVPYTTVENGGSKRWVFNLADYNWNGGNPTGTNMMEQLTQLKTNAPSKEWTIEYKVRRYNTVTRALEYINVPVLANALDVRGDNARYIGTTEGLLFNANASTFGTTTSVRDDIYRITGGSGKVEKKENGNWIELTDASDIDIALKTLLGYNADDAVGSCYYLTLENGNSMTIPNLKKGQHIRIKWSRYSKNHGDLVRAYNVTDLSGNDMNGATFTIGAGGNVDRNGGTGYHEFIVQNNGDVTFTVAENGWINIYEIDVDGEFINTDLRLADGESLIRRQNAGELFEHTYSVNWSDIQSQSNTAVTYSIKSGSRTGTLTEQNCYIVPISDVMKKLVVGSGGHGRFILVEEGKVDGSFVLDRKETLVRVYEYDYTPQSYPRTWNMENISAATVSALVADSSLVDGGGNFKTWRKADTDQFKMTLEPENLISWSTKATVDGAQTTINELNGLGIHPADITRRNNSIIFNNAEQSIDVSGADAQILTVPTVSNGHTAYIRVKKGTDASVTAKYIANTTTEDQELTTVYDDGTYAVYKAAGGGNANDGNEHTIEFYLNNVSVKQVAVSIDTKAISAAGYATEARNYPVDYTMTKTLDGHDYIAYKITGVSGNKVIATNVEYVPTGAGVMITGNETSAITRPIFTTDVNRSTSDMEGNLLIGLLSATAVDQSTIIGNDTYYNYILANKGRKVIEDDNGVHTAGEEVTGLGYYLLYKQGTILGENETYSVKTLKKNSAYLRLSSFMARPQELDSGSSAPAMVPQFCFFLGGMNDDETTAIETVSINSSDVIRGEDGVYYTLQGVRVTTPAKGNVYILNGKKIFIK